MTNGRQAFTVLRTSRHYQHVDALTISPELAERLFLPADEPDEIQRTMTIPTKPWRLAWRAEFAQAQAEARGRER